MRHIRKGRRSPRGPSPLLNRIYYVIQQILANVITVNRKKSAWQIRTRMLSQASPADDSAIKF